MVHTRKSFEALKLSPKSEEKRPGKAKKAVKIQVDETSEESGLETAPFSSKRRLRYNKGNHEHPSKPKKNELCGVHNLRSSKAMLADNTQPQVVVHEKNVTKSCTKSVEKDRSRRRRISDEEDEDLIEPSIRRSARRRRGVYDTLNINMLTDHRYIHSFDSIPIHDVKKLKKQQKEHPLDVDDLLEGNHVNMYDHVKRRHETPTPEKRARDHGVEEGDGDDEEDEDNEGSDDSQEEDDQQSQVNKYLLRKRRPVVNRYIAPPMHKKGEKKDYLSIRKKLHRNPPPHTSPVRRYQHKRKAINMSSSTSSDDSCIEEKRFERRKSKSTAKARMRALPVNLTIEDISKGILRDRDKIGSSLADIDPMSIDKKVQFDSVGGLEKQIKGLKEMILFPLVYPEVFCKFKINPPRGVLFYGPPGTGKTLVARALANECSLGNQKVAFFMRKGADCLSKWVGESERQLRLLFDQAYSMRPSIIFFDEIDGLAPVRSSRQDQIHSSIVSTLLALMDGLDSRGEVVVIGATNRIDAIDPALRRPGRFDREFQFPLPNKQARRHILSIHTKDWEPKPSQTFINELADYCVGYCGADIKALCTEAALSALRRRYPQVYSSNKKLLLDVNSIEVNFRDFFKATKAIVPAFQRSIASPARALSESVKPLLQSPLDRAFELLSSIFPKANTKMFLENSLPTTSALGTRSDCRDIDELSSDDDYDDFPSIYCHLSMNFPASSSRSERYLRRIKRVDSSTDNSLWTGQKMFDFHEEFSKDPAAYRPRLLLAGEEGAGQTTHLAPAILHCVEHLTVFSLDLPALYGVTARTPEEACSQLFREARRSPPSIIYMPHIHSLWNATNESLHATLLSLLQDLPPLCSVLLLATTNTHYRILPVELQKLFSTQTNQVLYVDLPNAEERRVFFKRLFLEYTLQTTRIRKARKRKSLAVLPFAPAPAPRQLSEAEIKKVQLVEENTLRELRIFLRDIHHKLIVDRRFKEFTKPVDLEEVPDYLDVVDEPMDLSIMMQKIDCHQYNTCAEYLLDIDLITSNALKYNPDIDPLDKIIRHRACELRDNAHSVIASQLEPEFEKTCEEIIAARQQRGETSVCLPAFVHTLPKPPSKKTQDTSLIEQKLSPPATHQQSSPLNTVAETHSQPSAEFQVKRKRRKKSYWFGSKRRSSHKKKALTDEMETGNDDDDESQNGNDGEVSNDNGGELPNNNSGVVPNDNGGHVPNGSKSINDVKEKDVDEKSNHDSDQDQEQANKNIQSRNHFRLDNQGASIPSPQIANSSSECLQNGDIDDSSNSSNYTKTNRDLLKTAVEDEQKPPEFATVLEIGSNKGRPSQLESSIQEFKQKDDNMEGEVNKGPDVNGQQDNEKDELLEKQDGKTNEKPIFNHLTATVALTSLSLESFLTDNKSTDEVERIEFEPIETHSEETVNKWKQELYELLDQMVDMTKGCNVETLERYHNRLQLSVYQHRYNADKSELIKDFRNLMKSNFALPT